MRSRLKHEATIRLSDGTTLQIRDMLKEDVCVVARLEAETFSMPWSEKSFLEEVGSKDSLFIVVYKEDKLVGYCGFMISWDEGDICNVAVSPEMRRKGLGEQMLLQLMVWGKEMDIEDFTLEVRKSNLGAIALYEKLGFVSEGIRKNFYEKPTEDAVIMWKRTERE